MLSFKAPLITDFISDPINSIICSCASSGVGSTLLCAINAASISRWLVLSIKNFLALIAEGDFQNILDATPCVKFTNSS